MKKPLEEVLKEATPGPWIVNGRDVVRMPDRWPVCNVLVSESDACILAHFRNVGPELVEALEAVSVIAERIVKATPEYRFEMDAVKAALSRAKEVEVP